MSENLLKQLENQVDDLIERYQALQQAHQTLEKNYQQAVSGIKHTIDRLEKMEQNA